MAYFAALLVGMAIAAIAALALNLILGYAGQLAVTQGALMGVGAYTVGLLSVNLGIDPAYTLWLAAAFGGLIGAAFAALSIRFREYDYVLVSLVLQMMVVEVFRRWTGLTRGGRGLGGIERPTLLGLDLTSQVAFAAMSLVLVALFAVVMYRLTSTPYGLSLRAFRGSEESVAALGKNTTHLRLTVGLIAGLGGGLAGGLHASFIGFITPNDFTEFVSILIIIYILVGGSGNMSGVLLGVALIVAIPEVVANFRFVSTSLQGPVERILYGLIVIGFVSFRPQGLLPERRSVTFAKVRGARGTESVAS